MIIYRCDICKQVHSEKSVPDSWRTLTINEDEDSTEGKYLACTACITSFNAWMRQRQITDEPARRKS